MSSKYLVELKRAVKHLDSAIADAKAEGLTCYNFYPNNRNEIVDVVDLIQPERDKLQTLLTHLESL